MRRLLPVVAACLLVAGLLAGARFLGFPVVGRPPPWNLLLVTLDTTRPDFISGVSGERGITPHLHAFAERSAVFTRAWSETNATSPSHLTILSGLHAKDHGVVNNRTPVPEGVDTFAEALSRKGHATGAFVAVRHLAADMGWRGFDTFPDVGHELDAAFVNARVMPWIAAHHDDPFFVWVHYWEPHALYEPPPAIARKFYSGNPRAGSRPPLVTEAFFRKERFASGLRQWIGDVRDPAYPRALYAGELHYVDQFFGQLLDTLEALDLSSRTIVVVVADHGESLDEHGIYFSHAGLYEPQLRIPLIFHVPGWPAVRSDVPVTQIDIVPTLAELFDVEMRHALPGESLVPILRDEPAPELSSRRIFVHQNAHNVGVVAREGDWKLIWPIDREHQILGAEPQLFDLASDPGERENLASRHPERVARMRERIEPWIEMGPVRADASHLEPEALEQLRALGYVDPS